MALSLLTTPTIQPAALPPAAVEALYVHIPFCFHKCHYCDFYSITRQSAQRMERFVDLLLAEADHWLNPPAVASADWKERRNGNRAGPHLRPKTLFFGGGTPTLLPLEAMRRLIQGLRDRFDFSDLQEWTVEANPATVTEAYCEMLRRSGVDRLSFGAQSFRPEELAALERHHDPEDVPRSLEIARRAGFRRLNLDLIYAIPGQTLSDWQRSLESAIALDVPHLSCYGLTYEPNTPMAVRKRLGHFRAVEEDVELRMLHHTRRRLIEANRPPYEISNYAIPGEQCLHNLVYWTGGDYIALGPSAASHVQGRRWRNRPHLGEWESAIESGILPATDVEVLSPRERAGELAMLMLRLERGLRYDDFARRSGFDVRDVFAGQLARLGDLGLIVLEEEGVRLSESGLNVADAVASEFLAAR